MCMLTHRLQVLLDDDRYQRLQAMARDRGVPVAVLVREAIDRGIRSTDAAKSRAYAAIAAADPIEVPDVTGLVAELEELRGRRG